MPIFWTLVAVMVLAAIAILLLPLLRRSTTGSVARDQLNLAIHRERLAELKRLQEEGELTAAEYDQAVSDLEQDLADDLRVSGDQASETARGRGVAMAVVLAVPLLSVGLYLALGSSAQIPLFEGGETQQAAAGNGMHSLEEMVTSLEQRLRDDPNQPEGWYMLGRSYMAMERYSEAATALRRANEQQAGEPGIMVAYAQALALEKDGNFTGEPAQLVSQVLEKEPDNPQALFLAGIASFQSGALEQAIGHWRKVLVLQPPGSEDAKLLESYIGKAKDALVQQGKAVPEVAAAEDTQQPAAAAEDSQQPAAEGGASLSLQVSLAPDLGGKVKATDTVFVYAVAVNGPRMPLAIQRLTVADLPAKVILNDGMAMMPAMRLSNFPEVTVGARVSFSGGAVAESGDLEGLVTPVTVAKVGGTIPVVIDTTVP